jgi:hypothetical protein
VEQQQRHAEAKREFLTSRSFKMSIVGTPQHLAAPLDHARLIIHLCVPTAR